MVVAGANWTVRLWRRTSLMQRLAFIALVPTLVTAALLVVMLTRYQLNTLRGMAQSTADAIATQAACMEKYRMAAPSRLVPSDATPRTRARTSAMSSATLVMRSPG